jgi:MerR family transcriptional regulator, light-induced transcriptional regulator
VGTVFSLRTTRKYLPVTTVHTDTRKMAVYSIRDLEKLTGIKKHTIRIWEQRYRLIQPRRTDTNIRYYTDDELRLLFNVALLNRNGYKISKLASMPTEQIASLVAGIAEQQDNPNAQIDALTLAMLNLDEPGFERIFTTYEEDRGIEQTMIELVYPLLENLKALWITRSISPAHEKFVIHLIRRKMLRAIDQVPLTTQRDAHIFFLYLPEGESHELTLLFMHLILRSRQHRVVYLGTGISLTDLRDACGTLPPHFVFTILDTPLMRNSVQHYLDHASTAIQQGQLLVTGSQVFLNPVKPSNNLTVLSGLPDTLTFLDTLKKRS